MNLVQIDLECPDGELNITTKERIREQLAVKSTGADVTVVDISGVKYIDSSGLSMLLLFSKSRDGRVYFFGAGGQVKEILDNTGLGNVLKMYNTKREAETAGVGAYESIFGRM